MVQIVLVGGLFLGAAFFLGRRWYLQFTGRKQPGCEKCAAKQTP